MFITMKFIHIVALLLGGTATVAPWIMQRSRQISGVEGPPPAFVPLAMRAFGLTGLLAIILLWISGLVMLSQGYGGLGMWFGIKMLAATLILGISAFLNILTARAARSGEPVNPAVSQPLLNVIRISLLVAILAAILVFN